MIACLGERKNGHLPPVCSIRIAMNLSTDPRIALWTMTGLWKPGFTCCSSQVKSSQSNSSALKVYDIRPALLASAISLAARAF